MAMSEEQRRAYARIRMYEDQMDGVVLKGITAKQIRETMQPDRTDEQFKLGVRARRDGQPRDWSQSVLWLTGWDEAGDSPE
jgi:hypothetical protein